MSELRGKLLAFVQEALELAEHSFASLYGWAQLKPSTLNVSKIWNERKKINCVYTVRNWWTKNGWNNARNEKRKVRVGGGTREKTEKYLEKQGQSILAYRHRNLRLSLYVPVIRVIDKEFGVGDCAFLQRRKLPAEDARRVLLHPLSEMREGSRSAEE